MKAEEALTSPLVKNGVNGVNISGGGGGGGFFVFGKSRYKLWALAAILLLAFWSMFTGTVTLKWSAGNLNPLSDRFDSPIHDDLDVLELEEREKLVRQMWDVYTHSKTTRLPSFWLEAFEAAYEELTSDVPDARNAAVSEIARMALRSTSFEPLTVQSTSTREARITSKQADKGKKKV
ncbi:hypothetical protein RHMOL_Rhmol06G0045100 [Rhododendron molle]|uniref:Uncharacterized protein n=1 Tax=Rhododendron molle TaxID=49168 RepID=A0ACC0N9Y0_RHOML|nr:hypothetical protein RHMOL_Rhmol06G0045100 [Rhododendron molle]